MATPNYTEEEILFRRRARRRLVGAVVLVVSVVAIVPMILPESKPQSETQQIEIRIPAQDASGYAPKIVAAPESGVAVAEAAKESDTASPAGDKPEEKPSEPQTQSLAPADKVPADKVKEVVAPVIAAAKPTEAAKTTVTAKQTYFVQYGAFSESKNAKQRQAELKTKGINTFTEIVKTSAGDKIRVRSGPYPAREDAEKIRTKVKPLDTKLVVMGDDH